MNKGAMNMALIDWSKVGSLREEVGADSFGEVVELFLDEVEDVISKLGAQGRSPEHDLHFLKGSAMNLGFDAFSDLCRAGEAAAAAGEATTIDIGKIVDSYHQSKEAFLGDMDVKLAG